MNVPFLVDVYNALQSYLSILDALGPRVSNSEPQRFYFGSCRFMSVLSLATVLQLDVHPRPVPRVQTAVH